MNISQCINIFQKVFKIKFSKQQKQILHFSYHKPLVVNACAGSGKTTMIMFSMLILVLVKHVNPTAILGVTFTRAARHNMQLKYKFFIDKLNQNHVSIPRQIPHFSTFHALFYHIILDSPKYQRAHVCSYYMPIMMAHYRKYLYKFRYQLMKSTGRYYSFKESTRTLFSQVSIYRAHDCSYDGLVTHNKKSLNYDFQTGSRRLQELSMIIVKSYVHWKRYYHMIDFGDMAMFIIKAIRNHSDLSKIARSHMEYYRYAFVDEFQDISEVQAFIIDCILTPAAQRHLVMVGDDDQSIYSFRGADPSIIIRKSASNFTKSLPLSINYRTGNQILRQARFEINRNQLRVPKKLLSGNYKSNSVQLIEPTHKYEYAFDHLVHEILVKIQYRKSGTIGILVRKNRSAALIADALADHYYYIPSPRLFQQDLFYRVIVNTLKALYTHRVYYLYKVPGNFAFDRVIKRIHGGRRKHVTLTFAKFVKEISGQKLTRLSFSGFMKRISKVSWSYQAVKCRKFLRTFVKYEWAFQDEIKHQKPFSDLLKICFLLDNSILVYFTGGSTQRVNYLSYVVSYLSREGSKCLSCADFFTQEQRKVFRIKAAKPSTRLHLMTIHHAKGLQFDNVFMPSLDNSMLLSTPNGMSPKTSFKRYLKLTLINNDIMPVKSFKIGKKHNRFHKTVLYLRIRMESKIKKYGDVAYNVHDFMEVADSPCVNILFSKDAPTSWKLSPYEAIIILDRINLVNSYNCHLKRCRHNEEERRIFYVGCTRASRHLYLSISAGAHCQFVDEMKLPKSCLQK